MPRRPSATASLISSDDCSSSATVSRRCSRPTSSASIVVGRGAVAVVARARGARPARSGRSAARCAAGRAGASIAGAVDRGAHGTARVVSEHDDQRHLEHGDGVLEAADDRVGDDLAGVAHDEQVAEALVEDDLGRETRVGAAEQRRARASAPAASWWRRSTSWRGCRGSPATKRALPRCISSQAVRGVGASCVTRAASLRVRVDLVGDGSAASLERGRRRRRRTAARSRRRPGCRGRSEMLPAAAGSGARRRPTRRRRSSRCPSAARAVEDAAWPRLVGVEGLRERG